MEDIMDRSIWRKLNRMVDDQDRCEWVNASSGTGSAGQSQTKGCKTVVVLLIIDKLTQNDYVCMVIKAEG